MLTFAYPWMFFLLPLPLAVRWLLPAYCEIKPAVHVPFLEVIAEGAGRKPTAGSVVRRRDWIQLLLYVLVWAAAVAALARPQWLEPPMVKELPTRDLLLAVDLSGSMETEDFKSADGRTVDRLTAVKGVLDDFLQQREGDRVGMIVFGTMAFVQVPFTQDLGVCRQLMEDIVPRMAGPKTALGDSIGLAMTLFERSKVKNRILIILTDGSDTGSRVAPVEAARIAADKAVTIYTIAVGDPAAVGEEELDEETLKAVADKTGGRYFFAADRGQLASIYAELDRIETRKVDTMSYRPRRDLFHWPLAVALLACIGYHLPMALRRAIRIASHQSVEQEVAA